MVLFKSNSILSIFVICFFLFVKNAYCVETKSTADIKAEVLQDISQIIGGVSFYELEKQKNILSFIDGSNGYFFEGKLIYQIQSEPNSSVIAYYQLKDNNFSPIVQENFYTGSANRINFDKKGLAELEINPKVFIHSSTYNANYKATYYVTLFY